MQIDLDQLDRPERLQLMKSMLGLSQKEIAGELGIDQSTVSLAMTTPDKTDVVERYLTERFEEYLEEQQ